MAKGFTQNLDALKHMYSDITGVPADKVSTMTILSGKVPDVMKEPRAHFIREHVIRGGINALGVGLIARAMFKGKAMGYIEGLAPVAASIGADALLGNSILPSYSGISNAQRNGQQLPAEVYTEFLMGASGELQRRGRMGHRMAILLGEEFAKENIKIPDLLKEIEASNQAHKHGKKAKFDERIEGLLATAEAQQKAADAQRKVQPAAGAQAQLHSQKSMVERVNNSKGGKDIVVQGKHTSRLKQEIANKDQMLISGVTPS